MRSVKITLTELSMRLFNLIQAWMLCRYGCMCAFAVTVRWSDCYSDVMSCMCYGRAGVYGIVCGLEKHSFPVVQPDILFLRCKLCQQILFQQ